MQQGKFKKMILYSYNIISQKIKYYMNFLVMKKRTLCVIVSLLILTFVVLGTIFVGQEVYSPKSAYTIVIDAGHGGVDVKLGQYIK